MKIRRNKDGKVYQVLETRNASICSDGCLDVLVHGTDERSGDVVNYASPPGQMWLDGYQAVRVPDSTPVDVP